MIKTNIFFNSSISSSNNPNKNICYQRSASGGDDARLLCVVPRDDNTVDYALCNSIDDDNGSFANACDIGSTSGGVNTITTLSNNIIDDETEDPEQYKKVGSTSEEDDDPALVDDSDNNSDLSPSDDDYSSGFFSGLNVKTVL